MESNSGAKQMSAEQKRVLLHKHLTGEFPGQDFRTICCLIESGHLVELKGLSSGTYLQLTDKGKAYCDAHHLEM